MLRSIRSRVVALVIAVALVSIVVTAVLVSRDVEASMRDDAELSLDRDNQILATLTDFAYAHSDWTGVGTLVRQLAADNARRIALVGADGRVIVDSDRLLKRAPRPLPRVPAAVIDPGALFAAPPPLDTAEGTVGTSEMPTDPPIEPGTGADTEAAVRLGDVTACLDDQGITYVVETDDEGSYVLPDADLSESEYEAFDICNAVLMANSGWPALFPEAVAGDRSTDETLPLEAPTITPSGQVAGFPAPRAQLFLGSRTEAGIPLAGLGAARLASIIALVLLGAAAVAWAVSRLVTRPLDQLATAVAGFGSGARGVRAPTTGSDEVARVAVAFNTMAGSLDTAEELRRRMVSDLAHELRNPLVTINGTLEALQDGVYEPTSGVVDSLAEETAHLSRLVADLQELATADAGQLRLDLVETSLSELCSSVVEAHGAIAVAAGVQLTVATATRGGDAPRGVHAAIDSGRLRQALTNLVANAIRHTSAGGSVTVVSREDGPDHVVIRVTDDGEGIPADEVPFVFERFWRSDASRSRLTGGSGLGLAITRGIVEAHGGTISVESTVGAGSTFTVRLPRSARG